MWANLYHFEGNGIGIFILSSLFPLYWEYNNRLYSQVLEIVQTTNNYKASCCRAPIVIARGIKSKCRLRSIQDHRSIKRKQSDFIEHHHVKKLVYLRSNNNLSNWINYHIQVDRWRDSIELNAKYLCIGYTGILFRDPTSNVSIFLEEANVIWSHQMLAAIEEVSGAKGRST